jgi:ribose 5-phosphate isomerase B
MMNLSDAELKKIVDEVVSSLTREMPTRLSPEPDRAPQKIKASENGTKGIVAIGADHGGFPLKQTLISYLEENGYQVVDCGTNSTDSVDYPDFAKAVADQVASGQAWRGIMIDGAGIGSCMAANKVSGVRAAMCYDHATAFNSREHNNANLLTLGAGLIGSNLAKQIVNTFLETKFGGDRHARRVDKIMAIES